MDGGINIFKFDPRWYHHQIFDLLFPKIATVFPASTNQYRYNHPTEFGVVFDNSGNDDGNNRDDHSLPSDNGYLMEPSDPADNDSMDQLDHGYPTRKGDQMDPGDMIDDGDKENSTPHMPCASETVMYQHIQECSYKLARTCQNDQPKMRTIVCNINQMIERVRDGQDIFVDFAGGYVEIPHNSNAPVDTNGPRAAISRAIPNSTGVKQMKSGREYNSRNQKKH
jgi:hypothetical protein